jgi:hypothetical protein
MHVCIYIAKKSPRKDRRKSRDLGKRMGGGQKGIWGNPSEILPSVPALDGQDPNYDSETEENVILVPASVSPRHTSEILSTKEYTINPTPELKKRIIEIIDEYLTSGEIDEVKRYLSNIILS